MGQLVHFYSTNVGWRDDLSGPGVTGSKRAAATGALGFEIVNFDAFVMKLQTLKSQSTKIDRMVIETHGSPGALYFGTDCVNWARISSLDGNGFEDMFESNARIFLNGCNIAETECTTGTCGPAGNGRKFLMEMARVFLRTNGGRVGASTSKGIPFFNDKVYHLWGETVYAVIARGGRPIRIVAGTELSGPGGQWKVTLQDGSVEFYWFYDNGKVTWNDGSFIGGDSGKGIPLGNC